MKKLLLIVLTALAVSGFYSCSKAESTADDEVLEDTLDFEEYYSTLKATNDEMAIKLKEKEATALEMQEAFSVNDTKLVDYIDISHLNFMHEDNGVGLYFYQDNSGHPLNIRFVITYATIEFRMFGDALFNIDGEEILFTPNELDVNEVNRSHYSRWQCDAPACYNLQLLDCIAKADKVSVMLGSYFQDTLTMTRNQRIAFNETLEYYNLLRGIEKDKQEIEFNQSDIDRFYEND